MKQLIGKTELEREVANIVNQYAEDYDGGVVSFSEDIRHGGLSSGLISELIYYKDTIDFFERHLNEINLLIRDTQDNQGEPISSLLRDFDKDDPLALGTHNQNLLAWFAFEETFFRLYNEQFEDQ